MCKESASAVIVDPGGEAHKFLKVLTDRKLNCQGIWLTHSHLDHCGGVKALKKELNVPLYAHPNEAQMRAHVQDLLRMYGLPGDAMENCPEPEVEIKGGEELQVGDYAFKTIFTPGHSPGHICFYSEKLGILIAGDTLFAGSIGRTDLPGGNHTVFMETLKSLMQTLPPATKVLPGHGPDTSLKVESSSNPFLMEI